MNDAASPSTEGNTFGCDQGEKDDKIIAVCADDPEYRHYNDISELSPHRLQEIKRFFEDCILHNIIY
jgi:inorganic pyrophosphatase